VKKSKEVTNRKVAGKKAILIGVKERNPKQTEEDINELKFLSLTLRLIIKKIFEVRIHKIHPATYIGKGKIEEIKQYLADEKIHVIVFQKELTPIQQRNIEEILNVNVIDRTQLILYIFAEHAKTREGKIQVELAQLSYLLPRLTKHGIELSRLGGGLGTRGPGEMKLEVHRRRIKDRINKLQKDIKNMEKHRNVIRSSRKRKNLPLISLLGYTNVGKSSILNKLSTANLYVANKLFSTLDPATRGVYLGPGKFCLISDTVGLLYNIPHHLIDSFKSTLEEAIYADLLICVLDVSFMDLTKQKNTIFEVLKILGIEDKKSITVYNKIDLISTEELNLLKAKDPEGVFMSAKQEKGIETLKGLIGEKLHGVKIS
jgi:GTPase